MNNRLFNLMQELKRTNAYFSEYFSSREITEENCELFFSELPVIRKIDIETNLRSYIDSSFMPEMKNDSLVELFHNVSGLSWNHDRVLTSSRKEWRIETTTGSTGKPFSILKSKNEKLFESRHLVKCRRKTIPNISWDNGFLLLEPRENLLKECYRQTDKDSYSKMAFHLANNEYEWILSTATQLRNLYKSIIENKLESAPSLKKIRFIETTSQALDEDEKLEMASIFPNALFCSQYGCREVWNLAYECPCGKLHINQEYLRLDLIDSNGQIIQDENTEGEVIVTSFLHKSMPFFKYYLGDRCFIKHGNCECGNKDPWIVLRPGRSKQKLVGTEYYGSQIFRKIMRFMYFHHPEYQIKNIKIIQKEITTLDVYVLMDEKYKDDFQNLFLYEMKYNLIDPEKYIINFNYRYPFINDPKALKEEIFETLLDAQA